MQTNCMQKTRRKHWESNLKPNALMMLISFHLFFMLKSIFRHTEGLSVWYFKTPDWVCVDTLNITHTDYHMKDYGFSDYLYVKTPDIKFLICLKELRKSSSYPTLDLIQRGTLSSSCGLVFHSYTWCRASSQSLLSTLLACRASIILGVSVYAGKPSNITCRLWGFLPEKKSDFTLAWKWKERKQPSYSNHGSSLDPPSKPPPSE